MKRCICLCFLVLSSSHLFAGSWAAGIAGAAEAGQEILRRQAEMDRDEAMMLRHHDLEMQRITREYELMAQQQLQLQEQEQIREQAKKYAAEQQQTKRQREALRAKDAELIRDAWLRQIEDVHPGWVETTRNTSFLSWRTKQPESVQALGTSGRAADLISMLDLYKRDVKPRKTASKKISK